MISISVAATAEDLQDSSFNEEVKKEISNEPPKHPLLTVSIYTAFPNKFVIFPGKINLPPAKYLLLSLPLFFITFFTPVLFHLSIVHSWGDVQGYEVSNCTILGYQEMFYYNYYNINLNISYMSRRENMEKGALVGYSINNIDETFVMDFYRESYWRNASFICYCEDQYVIAMKIVDYKVNQSWDHARRLSLGLLGATIILMLMTVLCTSIMLVQGRKTRLKWDREKKLIMESWRLVPPAMIMYIHAFLETYYPPKESFIPSSRIVDFNVVEARKTCMKPFLIAALGSGSIASFVLSIILHTIESKMTVCWTACYVLTVMCCCIVWVFFAGRKGFNFTATVETTTSEGTSEQLQISHGDYYTSLGYGYIMNGNISTITPENNN